MIRPFVNGAQILSAVFLLISSVNSASAMTSTGLNKASMTNVRFNACAPDKSNCVKILSENSAQSFLVTGLSFKNAKMEIVDGKETILHSSSNIFLDFETNRLFIDNLDNKGFDAIYDLNKSQLIRFN